jgi:hypothetical protein
MSEAQKQVLMWVGIIGLICYLLNINPVSVVEGFTHGAQQMHQANTHH